MNTRAPFDTGQCCTGNNDAIVDHLLGNAYQVVKFVAMRMPFIKTVSDNIGSVNTVATDIAQVKVVAADIVAVRAVAADIASVKNVSTNMPAVKNVSDNMPKLTAIHAELPQLSANSADIAAFKSGTGSTMIGHTPASGGATTVDAALKGLRTDVDGKAAKANTLGGYGITDAYTKTEADNEFQTKAMSIGAAIPTDQKANRALTNWYTNTAASPIQVTMAVNPEAAGGCVLSGYVRSAAGQTQFLVGATTLNGLTTSDRVAVSFLVPAGWQFQVDHFNAGVITSWTEF